jgi:hypothetical protein
LGTGWSDRRKTFIKPLYIDHWAGTSGSVARNEEDGGGEPTGWGWYPCPVGSAGGTSARHAGVHSTVVQMSDSAPLAIMRHSH